MSASHFDKIMSAKSDAELIAIIEDSEGYQIEARESAVRQLDSRNGETSKESVEIDALKSKLIQESDVIQERKRRKERFFYFPKKPLLLLR